MTKWKKAGLLIIFSVLWTVVLERVLNWIWNYMSRQYGDVNYFYALFCLGIWIIGLIAAGLFIFSRPTGGFNEWLDK
jgi:hypothetical protein